MTKRVLLNLVKTIAGIAAVVFLLAPLSTWTQVLAFIASIVVMLICFAATNHLDDKNTGFWSRNPE
jgi:urea transporter